MTDSPEEGNRLRDDARRARADMERARGDLERARAEARAARDEADRLRRDARDIERGLRHESRRRGPRGPWRPEGPNRPDVPDSPFALPDLPGSGENAGGIPVSEALALDGVRSVTVEQTAGKLTVRSCREGETPGVVSGGGKGAPRLEVRREGDALVVEVQLQRAWLFRRRQGATTLVRLNPGLTQLKLDLGYGEIELRDFAAEVIKLEVGAGTITSYSTRGTMEANMGAGKVSFHDHSGVASCDTGTGDVLLDIAEAQPGNYRVDVGMGKAEVRLPAGLDVLVKASSGIGKTKNDYPQGPEGSSIRLKMSTGIGELIVRARDASQAPAKPPVQPKPQRGSRTAPPPRKFEAEELRVLQMLEQGRISSQDAADLIAALRGAAAPAWEAEAQDEVEGAPR
ncbi:MAG: hypothetical protein ABIP13_07895, partial [Tepidiformaceae bacterium]